MSPEVFDAVDAVYDAVAANLTFPTLSAWDKEQ